MRKPCRNQLESVYRSKSWKITAPFRRLKKLIKGSKIYGRYDTKK